MVRCRRILKFGWLLLCLAALAGWWFGWGFVDGAGQRIEYRQFLVAVMGVLAFPAGLLWVWIASNLESLAGFAALAAGVPPAFWRLYGPEVLAWLGATLLGYIQWFWLLPYIFRLRSGG
ncbi:MAG: hypothetical protein JSW48_04635 [Betaproteobacteria bacterium]|jgi:hypothetical protein|nr:MAG: hypothetical protein JSW48_04635 [Betaproteobacteria bacterium]